jgi:hypothetical protein
VTRIFPRAQKTRRYLAWATEKDYVRFISLDPKPYMANGGTVCYSLFVNRYLKHFQALMSIGIKTGAIKSYLGHLLSLRFTLVNATALAGPTHRGKRLPPLPR